MSAPERLVELSSDTREWLAGLREGELETLKAIVEQPADDVHEFFAIVNKLRTAFWLTRWLIITMLALFLGTVTLYENILKVLGYLKGGPAQ